MPVAHSMLTWDMSMFTARLGKASLEEALKMQPQPHPCFMLAAR